MRIGLMRKLFAPTQSTGQKAKQQASPVLSKGFFTVLKDVAAAALAKVKPSDVIQGQKPQLPGKTQQSDRRELPTTARQKERPVNTRPLIVGPAPEMPALMIVPLSVPVEPKLSPAAIQPAAVTNQTENRGSKKRQKKVQAAQPITVQSAVTPRNRKAPSQKVTSKSDVGPRPTVATASQVLRSDAAVSAGQSAPKDIVALNAAPIMVQYANRPSVEPKSAVLPRSDVAAATKNEHKSAGAGTSPATATAVATPITPTRANPRSKNEAAGITPRTEAVAEVRRVTSDSVLPKIGARRDRVEDNKQATQASRSSHATETGQITGRTFTANRAMHVLREIQSFWQTHVRPVVNRPTVIAATAREGQKPTLPQVSSPIATAVPIAAVGTDHRIKSEQTKTTQKSENLQPERLGGTQAILQNNDRLKVEMVGAESAAKSFWGVKVVNDERLKEQSVEPKTKSSKPAPKETTSKEPVNADALRIAPDVKHEVVMPVRKADAQKDDGSRQAPLPEMQMPAETERNAGAVLPQSVNRTEVAAETARPAEETNPSTSPMVTTPAKEVAQPPMPNALSLKPLFTLEQIKELQAMVAKSLQGVRMMGDGAKEAVFNWSHDALGPLTFRISTRNDDVEIHIQSGRQDVADALKEGRGTVERMITDLGMKVERFEVKVRAEALNQDTTNQTHEREHSEQNQRPELETGSSESLIMETEAEMNTTPHSSLLAEREWLA